MNVPVVEAINRQINSELSASYFVSGDVGLVRATEVHRRRQVAPASEPGRVHARDEAVRLHPGPRRTRRAQASGGTASVVRLPRRRVQKALAQEQEVSRQIDLLYEIAFKEKAFAAVAELQWFLTEQVEEEKVGREIVAKFKLIGNDPSSILDMDRELGRGAPASSPGVRTPPPASHYKGESTTHDEVVA